MPSLWLANTHKSEAELLPIHRYNVTVIPRNMFSESCPPSHSAKLSAKKHTFLGVLAALIAAVITVSLHFYGTHDIQGLLIIMAGYPGLLANGDYVQLNETLLTVVNWLFYFLLFEGIAALKHKFST